MTDPFRDQLQEALGSAYRLDRELSGGGMSRVFVARERALDRDVVVKVLPPELAAGVNRERFRREIQLAAQLQHPHIVPLLSAGESGDLLYYTMPFIAGESLKEALARRGKLAVRDVVRILHDVVDALAYAHDRGIIHRDIKPANVLMSGAHAVITDFGVAKAISAALPLSGVTTAGVAIGTPAYMAPEQLAADPAADHRVDIYAVGLLAYELLTGESPFTGPSPAATMAAQLTRVPDPLDQCCPDVPAEFSAVIMRCLEKQPSERPSSAHELLALLDSVSTPQGGVYADPGVVRASQGISRRYVALLAVLFTVAIGSALALTYNHRLATERTTRAAVAVGDTAIPRQLTVVPTAPVPAVPAAPPFRGGSGSAAVELTPAESLAIAEAMQKRLAERQGSSAAGPAGAAGGAIGAGAGLDSLRAQLEAVLVDSVQRARVEIYQSLIDSMRREVDLLQRRRTGERPLTDQRWERSIERSMEAIRSLPEMQGRSVYVLPPNYMARETMDPARARRVAVTPQFINATSRAALGAYTRAAADALRRRLDDTRKYEVLPPEALSEGQHANDPFRIAQSAEAGIGIVGLLVPRRDSVYLQIHVGDLRHGTVFKAFRGPRAPLSDPLRGSDAVWNEVLEWLDRPVTTTRVRTAPERP